MRTTASSKVTVERETGDPEHIIRARNWVHNEWAYFRLEALIVEVEPAIDTDGPFVSVSIFGKPVRKGDHAPKVGGRTSKIYAYVIETVDVR